MIGFVIGAPRNKELLQEVAQTPESCWSPTSDPELECTDLDYVSSWGARQDPSQQLRYVVTRRELPGELGVGTDETVAEGQGRPAYRIRAYLSNLAYPPAGPEGARPAMTAAEVVRFAHERCGHGEEIHAVLKEDLAGGFMPSKRFAANAAWWHLAALSANVTAVLRQCAFDQDWLWARMKKVRRHWLHLIAKVVRHVRTQRIMFTAAHAQRMHRALGRMARSQAYDTS